MIEIFSTNVQHLRQARFLLDALQESCPDYRANFDLEDCDHVLRVANFKGIVEAAVVIRLLESHGFRASILPDTILQAPVPLHAGHA